MSAQSMRALDQANAIRLMRLGLRREVRAMTKDDGLRRIAALLVDDHPALRSAAVYDVLGWPRKMYERQAKAVMSEAAIMSLTRECGQLTQRQRAVLADELRALAGNVVVTRRAAA